jgi:hypothetical protein
MLPLFVHRWEFPTYLHEFSSHCLHEEWLNLVRRVDGISVGCSSSFLPFFYVYDSHVISCLCHVSNIKWRVYIIIKLLIMRFLHPVLLCSLQISLSVACLILSLKPQHRHAKAPRWVNFSTGSAAVHVCAWRGVSLNREVRRNGPSYANLWSASSCTFPCRFIRAVKYEYRCWTSGLTDLFLYLSSLLVSRTD